MDRSNSAVTDRPEVRIILLGKTGVGKSASGNTILGADLFPSEQSSSSVTSTCQKHSANVEGRRVTVVDTPDFFYETQQEDLSSEIRKSVDLASPGVHVFLYVLPLSTFTEQEADLVSLYDLSYGEEAKRHTVVLFTHGDQLTNMSAGTVIEQNEVLWNLVSECGGRYHVLNNKEPTDRQQVMRLLGMIDRMVLQNGRRCYTREVLEEAERRANELLEMVREEQHREEELKRRKHQRDLEKARRETEERVQREMGEELKREREAQAERERRMREQRERESEGRQTTYGTDESHTEKTENTKWMRFVQKLKGKHLCIIGVLITVAIGGVNAQNKGSEQFKCFTQGCLMGVLSMCLGSVSVKTYVCVRGRAVMSAPTAQRVLDKGLGVLCGSAAGALAGHVMGAGGGSRGVMLAGLAGACGAVMTKHPGYV